MNRVDELEKEIEGIRSSCTHQFEMTKEPTLLESLVPGTYVGTFTGQTEGLQGKVDNSFILKCSKCSLEQRTSALGQCPKCFESLVRDERLVHSLKEFNWDGRTEYFGCSYLYNAIRLSRCPNRHFIIASEEWDQ